MAIIEIPRAIDINKLKIDKDHKALLNYLVEKVQELEKKAIVISPRLEMQNRNESATELAVKDSLTTDPTKLLNAALSANPEIALGKELLGYIMPKAMESGFLEKIVDVVTAKHLRKRLKKEKEKQENKIEAKGNFPIGVTSDATLIDEISIKNIIPETAKRDWMTQLMIQAIGLAPTFNVWKDKNWFYHDYDVSKLKKVFNGPNDKKGDYTNKIIFFGFNEDNTVCGYRDCAQPQIETNLFSDNDGHIEADMSKFSFYFAVKTTNWIATERSVVVKV